MLHFSSVSLLHSQVDLSGKMYFFFFSFLLEVMASANLSGDVGSFGNSSLLPLCSCKGRSRTANAEETPGRCMMGGCYKAAVVRLLARGQRHLQARRGETLEGKKNPLWVFIFYFVFFCVVSGVWGSRCELHLQSSGGLSLRFVFTKVFLSLSLSLPAFQWQALTLTAFREDMTCSVSSHAHLNQNSQILFIYSEGRWRALVWFPLYWLSRARRRHPAVLFHCILK